ncbi:hypothetical protein Godav_022259, partial [Gossypium davidsonii]|nr:hypothetical protein [Gossypium davidsonii]
ILLGVRKKLSRSPIVGQDTAGGIVRDSNGKWIFGFCRYLGCCTVLDAELWGILDDGLAKMVRERSPGVRILQKPPSRELSICELSGGQLMCKNVDRLFILDELGGLSNDSRVVEKVITTLPKRYESKISSFEDSKDLSTISLLELINMLYA